MPYRYAHWYLLTLFPLVGLAFWPGYFSIFSASPLALHAHAAAGTLWLAILAAQSWMIHNDARDIHRLVGAASLAAFPFFLATGAVVSVLMAQQFANNLSPFDVMYDPRLGFGSIGFLIGFAYCYWQGLRKRPKVHSHSRYMLATAIFLLPPIFARLCRYVPSLHIGGASDLWKFALNIQIANALTAVIAFCLAWRAGKHGRPFLEAGVVIVMTDILLQTVGVLPLWQHLFTVLARVPLPVAAAIAGAAGIIIAYGGWVSGRRPTSQVRIAPA
jgi:hypothetical protein